MSVFGDGTFKQEVLDAMEFVFDDPRYSHLSQAKKARLTMEALCYFVDDDFYGDKFGEPQ